MNCVTAVAFVVFIAIAFLICLTFAYFFERAARKRSERMVQNALKVIAEHRRVLTTAMRLRRMIKQHDRRQSPHGT